MRIEAIFALSGFVMLLGGLWGGVSPWAALGVGGFILMLAAALRIKV